MSNPLPGTGNGIHTSPRPPISFPQTPNLSLTQFLFRNLSSHSAAAALIDPTNSTPTFTFYHLNTHVTLLSHSLFHHLNISQNDVVLILSPNSILFPVAFLAVTAIGAIATTVNPLYTLQELTHQVKDSKPKLIITVESQVQKVNSFNLPIIILSLSPPPPEEWYPNVPNFYYYSDLIKNVPKQPLLTPPPVSQDDMAALLYSSGTTGLNKGVVLTHRNFIATSLMVTSDQETYGESKNVFLCVVPMFHIMGLSVIVYSQLQRGNTVVVMAKFELEKMLEAIEKYRVTHLCVAPPVVLALVRQKEVVRRYDTSSLRDIGSGAAPLGKDMMEECAKVFPRAAIFQGYGMTETCGMISMENTRMVCNQAASGVLVPGVEAKIIRLDTLKPLPHSQLGEIWVRGPNMMQGYLNNQEATELTIDADGWVRTGDLGYFDEEERLYVVDRIKELIKCKGFQVAPAELEGLLITHPEIVDAAVIPFPDEEAGEVPVAYAVRAPRSTVTEEEVKKFIAEQVAPYKRLRQVTFIDAIPKSVSGKILRRELMQRVRSKL